MSDDDSRGLEIPDTIDEPHDNHTQSEPARGDATRETPIGVDIGEYNLYTLCAVDGQSAYEVSGEEICADLDTLRSQTAHLLASRYDRETVATYVQQRHDAILERIDAAAHECCRYASRYDGPLFVTEDSHYRPRLWNWLVGPDAHRGTTWLLSIAHLRLRAVAAEYAIPLSTVPVEYSSQECHACGVLGERILNTTLECRNPNCYVDRVAADHNASLVLAKRYYPGRCCVYRPSHSLRTDDQPSTDTQPTRADACSLE